MIGARTARLVIEPMSHGHAAELAAAVSGDGAGARPAWAEPATVEAWHARIDHLARGPGGDAGQHWVNFAMRRADDGVVIGRLEATIVLRTADAVLRAPAEPGLASYGAWAELAYLLGPAHQRRGFAREGLRWLIAELARAGVPELWLCIHPDNAPSLRLGESLGFAPAALTRSLGSYEPGDATLVRSSS